MAFLKFNKSELVNLSYSLKREIICANKTGAYCNTSIVTCNTRRYHGLLAVTLDRFGGDKFLLLSALDETLTVNGKQFNLGIHCYGDIYEPRGHKYVVDFSADPVPQITYKVGEIIITKTILLVPDSDQVMVKYELVEAPAKVRLTLKPFLAFRNIHDLTFQNDAACTAGTPVNGGVSYRLYPGFPDLYLQMNTKSASYTEEGYWYRGITYSDEYRRGFDCREDLYMPGRFEVDLKPGESVVFSAGIQESETAGLKRKFSSSVKGLGNVTNNVDQLIRNADLLITNHNNRKKICAGFSWMYTGLLRETLLALPGLALGVGRGTTKEFEEILDNLIADEQERLFRRTTQVEAPLYMTVALQKYIYSGASQEYVWKKYGVVLKGIIESYAPGERKEVSMQPNGLLWAQMDHVALSWMNAYVNGEPVTERPGYQIETNSFWYNALCFALDMEKKFGARDGAFVGKWSAVKALIEENFMKVFWNPANRCLADYVDCNGQNQDVRPNQLYALWVDFSPVPEEYFQTILHVVDNDLVTRRGIRSLSPRDVKYRGVYEGSQVDRDLAYHQGCAFPFLLEPYIAVCFKVKGPAFWKKAQWLTEGFYEDLAKHGVGAFSELYDGDPPHEAHGAISSALSTAALIVAHHLMEINKED